MSSLRLRVVLSLALSAHLGASVGCGGSNASVRRSVSEQRLAAALEARRVRLEAAARTASGKDRALLEQLRRAVRAAEQTYDAGTHDETLRLLELTDAGLAVLQARLQWRRATERQRRARHGCRTALERLQSVLRQLDERSRSEGLDCDAPSPDVVLDAPPAQRAREAARRALRLAGRAEAAGRSAEAADRRTEARLWREAAELQERAELRQRRAAWLERRAEEITRSLAEALGALRAHAERAARRRAARIALEEAERASRLAARRAPPPRLARQAATLLLQRAELALALAEQLGAPEAELRPLREVLGAPPPARPVQALRRADQIHQRALAVLQRARAAREGLASAATMATHARAVGLDVRETERGLELRWPPSARRGARLRRFAARLAEWAATYPATPLLIGTSEAAGSARRLMDALRRAGLPAERVRLGPALRDAARGETMVLVPVADGPRSRPVQQNEHQNDPEQQVGHEGHVTEHGLGRALDPAAATQQDGEAQDTEGRQRNREP